MQAQQQAYAQQAPPAQPDMQTQQPAYAQPSPQQPQQAAYSDPGMSPQPRQAPYPGQGISPPPPPPQAGFPAPGGQDVKPGMQFTGKMKIFIAAAAAVVILGGGFAVAMLSGALDGVLNNKPTTVAQQAGGDDKKAETTEAAKPAEEATTAAAKSDAAEPAKTTAATTAAATTTAKAETTTAAGGAEAGVFGSVFARKQTPAMASLFRDMKVESYVSEDVTSRGAVEETIVNFTNIVLGSARNVSTDTASGGSVSTAGMELNIKCDVSDAYISEAIEAVFGPFGSDPMVTDVIRLVGASEIAMNLEAGGDIVDSMWNPIVAANVDWLEIGRAHV
jgi:hypothetical protein